MDCYLCSEPLTFQNDSGEHIIPNSIGGKREVIRACKPGLFANEPAFI
ncbi:HNH endonuclease [Pseudomonas syringae group genomosp. 3]|nr:HNH endonuclease [Pseudomonas syringae group genomosp. 3]RMR31769.1 hypothetical protein ALP87_200059 [Pseudomonas syringae pv. coriandricola]